MTAEIEALRVSLKDDLQAFELRLSNKIEAMKNELIRWFIGIAFAQTALIVMLLRLCPGQ